LTGIIALHFPFTIFDLSFAIVLGGTPSTMANEKSQLGNGK
jgi:hypothetical protein